MAKYRIGLPAGPYDRNESPALLVFIATLTEELIAEIEREGKLGPTLREDTATLRRWLIALAKQNTKRRPSYAALWREINEPLKVPAYHLRLDERTHRLVAEESEDVAGISCYARWLAEVIEHRDHFRIRRCRECGVLFVTPSRRGPRRDFCSTTHANSNRQRRYTKRKAAQRKSTGRPAP